MSLWSGIKAAIYKPIRGIGRVVRGAAEGLTNGGDFTRMRAGLGDIGQGVKLAAPALAFTGIGAPLAVGIGAGAGALDKGVRKGASIGSIAKGALEGAGRAGAGVAAKGALAGMGIMNGAAAGAQAAGAAPAMSAVPTAGLASSTAPIAQTAATVAPKVSGIGRIASTVASGAKEVGKFAAKNPAVLGQVIGAGADVYGAQQAGAMEDKMLEARARAWENIRRRRTALGIAS